jgi:hypothetical protein
MVIESLPLEVAEVAADSIKDVAKFGCEAWPIFPCPKR